MPAATRSRALDALDTTRTALQSRIDSMLAAELPEGAAEARAANAAIQEAIEERTLLDERIRVTENEETRRAADADTQRRLGADLDEAGQPRAVILREPKVYDPHTRSSYFLDLTRDHLGRGDGDGGVQAARDRLARHRKELDVDLPAREVHRDKLGLQQTDRTLRAAGYNARARENAFERRTNPNRTDGQGGFFVPPTWLIDEYIDLPRFGRTVANLCQQMTLPSGTDSINLPKVATGTATASQGDNGAVQSTDLTDTSVSAAVGTVAGQQDIAMALLDQSPVSFDEVVLADLLADYNAQLDVQVINAILAVGGINTITYTDATPSLVELWPALLQSASKIATQRKMPATGVAMTPSFWYWALSQLDSTGRPLILSNPAAMNNLGENGLLEVDGPAGMFTYGLPAFMDGNIPSNLGAGTNETRAITARWQDLFLWEGAMRTRVLTEVLSGTLQVRVQVYNYKAFMPNRRPGSISVIGGTGMVSPAGF